MRSFFKSHIFHGLLFGGLISLGSGPHSAWATVRYVDSVAGNNHTVNGQVITIDGNNCDDPLTPCRTIGHAIAEAAAGDIIDLSASTFSTGFTCGLCDPGDYGLTIDKDLTIRGQGMGGTILDAGGVDRHFTITADATTVKIRDLTLQNGSSVAGGGAILMEGGVLTVRDSELLNNAAVNGGAIAVSENAELVVRGGTFTGNTAWAGGAIQYLNDTVSMEIKDSTFSLNSANDGGALHLAGSAVVHGSTFSTNEADNQGGAIFAADGDLTIYNNTFAENVANVGGGLAMLGPVVADVYSCTFVANESRLGSGGSISGSLDLTNTIITGSIGGDCAGASVVTGDNNLLDDLTCAPLGAINLGPVTNLGSNLRDNGGPTATYRLLAGSNAIDAGFGGCPNPITGGALLGDQRNAPRPQDGDGDGVAVCDIGAVERL